MREDLKRDLLLIGEALNRVEREIRLAELSLESVGIKLLDGVGLPGRDETETVEVEEDRSASSLRRRRDAVR